jgi:hypothetical protein
MDKKLSVHLCINSQTKTPSTMQKPTYKYICSSNQDVLQIDVFLSKKKTGTIKKFEDGWCYFPKGSRLRVMFLKHTTLL